MRIHLEEFYELESAPLRSNGDGYRKADSVRHIETMGQSAFDYRRLPLADRVQLVEDIWDSIAEEANVRPDALPLSVEQHAELRRRVDEADAHPDDAIPWERVREELFKRGK